MPLVTLIVLDSPRALNVAVPFAARPKVPNVVAKVASTTVVICLVKTWVLEYADATEIWSVEIVPAPYRHSRRFVPF